MKKSSILKTLLTVLMASVIVFGITTVVSAADSGSKKSGWVYEEAVLEYDYEGEKSYWFYYENGVRATGWKKINNNWYFLADYNVEDFSYDGITGAMVKDCWCQINGVIYHFNTSGVYDKTLNSTTSGWVYLHKVFTFKDAEGDEHQIYTSGWFYYDKGNPVTGWKQIGGSWYYFADKSAYAPGLMTTSCWQKINGSWYHFNASGVNDKSGSNLVGWVKLYDYLDNHPYNWAYFDKPGHNVTGWNYVNGKCYYMNSYDGSLACDQVVDGYYLDENGVWFNTPGWHDLSDEPEYYHEYIYIDGSGSAYTGWHMFDGEWYCFNEYSGRMVTDAVYKGYYFNYDGVCIDQPGWYDADLSPNETSWRYIDSSGRAATGWKMIGGKYYYFDEYNGYMYSGMIMDGYYLDYDGAWVNAPGWHNVSPYPESWEAYVYVDASGHVATGWKMIGGKWYYFDDFDGTMYSNSIHDGYYLGKDGAMVQKAGFYNRSEEGFTPAYVYVDSNGKAPAEGWFMVDGKWYYFSGYCIYRNGIENIDGKLYYFDVNGAWANGWLYVDDSVWYYDYDDNWHVVLAGKRWYYANPNSKLGFLTGWQKLDSNWYYFDLTEYTYSSGHVQYNITTTINTQYIDGKYYIFDDAGRLVKKEGWRCVDYSGTKVWYYADASGVVATGWKKINNEWYYFYEDGAMAYDKAIYEYGYIYYLDKSGKLIRNCFYTDNYGNVYYLDSDGRYVTGWKLISGSWYYFNEYGAMYSEGIYWIDGYYYGFTTEGKMMNGWKCINDLWYYFGSDGRAKRGLQTIDNKQYIFDYYGYMYSDWYAYDEAGNYYYCDSNGVATQVPS